MDLTEAAALLDEIAREHCRDDKIAPRFRTRADRPNDPTCQYTAASLEYRLLASGSKGRDTYGPFAPMIEMKGRVSPPYTWDLGDDALATWKELATLVQSPVVAARLHDLLWVRRFGDQPHEHARAAIDNYISATELAHCGGLEPCSFLDRAFDLSRELNVPGVAEHVGRRAVEELVAEYRRRGPDPRPGVVIRLLTLLVDLPAADRPHELHTRLDEAHAVFADNYPNNRMAIFQLQERLARGNPKEVARLRRASVELWIQWAKRQEDGLLQLDAFRQALKVAEETGQPAEVRNNIRRMIGKTDQEDIYTESFEVLMPIPPEMKELMDRVVGNDGIGPALDRFGGWWPPTGDPGETAAAADERRERFVFLSHVSQVVFDDGGRPLRYVETDNDKRAVAIVRQEVLVARTHAVFAQIVLDRMGQTYTPDQEELTTLFRTELITNQQAEVFARALQHYWACRFDDAIHIALPRLEAVLRERLSAVGGTVYTEPQTGTSATRKDGGVKSLGDIVQGLSECMPEEQRALRVLLTDAVGLNLRNRYLHGLVTHSPDDQALQQDAALVLWIAARLRLLCLKRRPDSAEVDD